MSVLLSCCQHQEVQQPYIGVDSSCNRSAIFCIDHDPHLNKEGLLHQMMPLNQFRRVINETKFKMSDKVSSLVDRYVAFMDDLIREISQLKLKKIVELSMLWLRELASNEQEYQNLRKIYRNEYEGLTCKDIHWLYFKVVSNASLEKHKIEDIGCYKDICKVMETLSQSVKAKSLITQKVSELEGIIQNGQLLKRALPDRRVLKQHTKQILLESLNNQAFDIKYNKITLVQGSRSYQSVFSKYSLIQHTNYHLFVQTKYTNVILGLCHQQLKKNKKQFQDLHYSQHSIAFNCSNGCVYRDGMFQSGSANLTKGQKQLQLILRITDTQFLILLGKNVICRTDIQQFKTSKLFLHMLLRTQGDSIEIDRDKFVVSDQNIDYIQTTQKQWEQEIDEEVQINQSEVDIAHQIQSYKSAKFQHSYVQQQRNSIRQVPALLEQSPLLESRFQAKKNHLLHQASKGNDSLNLKRSIGLKQQIPLDKSLNRSDKILKPSSSKGEKFSKSSIENKIIDKKSKINIQIPQIGSEEVDQTESICNIFNSEQPKDSNHFPKELTGKLINPAIIRRTQQDPNLQISFDDKFDIHILSPMPSEREQKDNSKISLGNSDLRKTQFEDWF